LKPQPRRKSTNAKTLGKKNIEQKRPSTQKLLEEECRPRAKKKLKVKSRMPNFAVTEFSRTKLLVQKNQERAGQRKKKPPKKAKKKKDSKMGYKPDDRSRLCSWRMRKGGMRYYVNIFGVECTGKDAYSEMSLDKVRWENRHYAHKALRSPSTLKEFEGDPGEGLKKWGVPDNIIAQYAARGIHKLYDWQADCLKTTKALDGRNLVYAAPTSGGKSMIAEMIMIRRSIVLKKKCLFVLPYVSLVTEKAADLNTKLGHCAICVRGFHSGAQSKEGFDDVDIAVCTIEKANSLINQLSDNKELERLCLVVVDELHMIGDAHRGYLLELMLIKLCMSPVSIQIVGMSATLPNLEVVADWLNADLYKTKYRPVPLAEYYKVGQTIRNESGKIVQTIDKSTYDNPQELPTTTLVS